MTQIITMFSGREHLVEDNEADEVAKNYNSNALLRLKSGARINPKGIESIDDPQLVGYWDGHLLDKNGGSFMRDGQRIFLEAKDYEEVEYKPHPKYIALQKIMIEKTKMISNKQQAEISEEVAREERRL